MLTYNISISDGSPYESLALATLHFKCWTISGGSHRFCRTQHLLNKQVLIGLESVFTKSYVCDNLSVTFTSAYFYYFFVNRF